MIFADLSIWTRTRFTLIHLLLGECQAASDSVTETYTTNERTNGFRPAGYHFCGASDSCYITGVTYESR